MEIILTDDDLSLAFGNAFFQIAPFAYSLDGGFNSFRTAIHRQHFMGIGGLAKLLIKMRQLVIAERAGC